MADDKPKTCETCKYRDEEGSCMCASSIHCWLWVGAGSNACDEGKIREEGEVA